MDRKEFHNLLGAEPANKCQVAPVLLKSIDHRQEWFGVWNKRDVMQGKIA
jgi:hypothetical protein